MNTISFIGGIGFQEVLLIAIVVLLFFGGKKIPALMNGLGPGVKTFKERQNRVSALCGEDMEPVYVQLVSTGLAQQFVIHVKTALCVGAICASPYVVYQLFRFVSPALYERERHYAVRIVASGYLMFLLGAAVSYFLVFPLTFRFLGTYQVSGEVSNMITLDSYISTLMTMTLSMGIVFEIPVVAWLLAHAGLLSSSFMRRYRRHAIVAILVVAAVITPTSDVFTLLVVSMPMYVLYELSIWLVKSTAENRKTS